MAVSTRHALNDKELNARLTKIFTKIGCLEKAQEGIRELYTLLIEYPECDVKVNAFLNSAGTFFQKYIRHALAEITSLEMRKCGMVPDYPPQLKPFELKRSHLTVEVPSGATSDCTSDSEALPEDSPPSTPGSPVSPMTPLTPMTKVFKEKITPEEFQRTRSRLHTIFEYEKYKNGQKRSSLPNLGQYSSLERLEYVKSIIRSDARARPSSWVPPTQPSSPPTSLKAGTPTSRFGSLPTRRFRIFEA